MNRILMATDFSNFSSEALDHAIYLVKKFNAELYLLHVFEAPYFTPPGKSLPEAYRWLQQIKMEEAKRFDALVEETRKRGIAVHPLFKNGRAALVINQTAKEIQADLVVVGSHGRGGMDRFVNGSVAEGTARTSPSPVLIVGPKAFSGKGGGKERDRSGEKKEPFRWDLERFEYHSP
jgi:nucleotide-binding universal stress UspA family protein